jgi:hypothetical protein
MSLQDWLAEQLIEIHHPSKDEIKSLLEICRRDIEKSHIDELGNDWKMSIAYNAALQSAAAALAAAGYICTRGDHHYRVIQSLAYTIKADSKLINQLDRFRKKRNISGYERMGMVTDKDVQEMMSLSQKLLATVIDWLKKNYPELAPE